ncbi:Regulatory protein IclR [[Clostridium] ultunense Esp]|uniref:IclR family transcriptional regulator n=1 Tax=Thermicanus aegyptius TaxID=94009 RepID=UPI0002B7094D|nr:IclR family transcriptional regulator [Thermicanus aegyptius]CCQ92286.1 Regulatory protein IclR [[Clostridium] ultunense Esp]
MEDEKNSVRSVERALDILLGFANEPEMGLTDIAKKVNLHKSTVFRLLGTLELKGFIIRDPKTDKYRLGYRILELASNLHRPDDPFAILLPEMEQLRDTLGETVSLYIREGLERIRILAVQSNQTIRRYAPIGQRMPLTVGASSKVLVAFADPSLFQMMKDEMIWPKNIDPAKYLSQIEEIRRLGYATSMEEREPGVSAVSAPILKRNGEIFAALAVSGPVQRLMPARMKEIAPIVVEAANRMSRMIS